MKQIGILATLAILTLPLVGTAAPRKQERVSNKENIAQGKQLAYENSKGNCLACHMIEDAEMPGNYGPPLIQMKQRYPSKAKLRAVIWDAAVLNPQTIMPPFGRHRVLTEEEIDRVVDYIYSL